VNTTGPRTPGTGLAYDDDWFGPPWRQPEIAVLLHGIAESAQAWRCWVPYLAAQLRVVRPDLPGFGRSPLPPPSFDWSPPAFAAEVARLLDALGLDAVHVVGAKYGGTIAMQFAADFPDRTRTLSVLSSPVAAAGSGGRVDLATFAERIRRDGVRAWAAETQRARLGPDVSEEHVRWWTEGLMAHARPEACIGAISAAGRLDIRAALSRIQAPALICTTEGSALQSVETARAYQALIPHSSLRVLPGSAYHVAAVRPDECARLVLEFIAEQRRTPWHS